MVAPGAREELSESRVAPDVMRDGNKKPSDIRRSFSNALSLFPVLRLVFERLTGSEDRDLLGKSDDLFRVLRVVAFTGALPNLKSPEPDKLNLASLCKGLDRRNRLGLSGVLLVHACPFATWVTSSALVMRTTSLRL